MVDPRQERRSNIKALLIAGAILASAAAALWLLAENAERFFTTGGKQYGSSLARSVDAAGAYGDYYVLRSHGEDCWTARAAKTDSVRSKAGEDVFVITEVGRSRKDCVGISDYLWPTNPDGFAESQAGPSRPFELRSSPAEG
jgi:hypothetical protein